MKCCMCCKDDNIKDMLTPRICLVRHGLASAHKICQQCWFNCFAVEGGDHRCPGCPPSYKIDTLKFIIDITDE